MDSTKKLPEPEVPIELNQEHMEDQLPPLRNLKPNNNRHVVTFGIFICLFTLYITATAIRQSNNSLDSGKTKDEDIKLLLKEKENQRQAMILEKLQEHEHICSELEIFIKEFKWNDKSMEESVTPTKEVELKYNSNKAEQEKRTSNLSETSQNENNDINQFTDTKIPKNVKEATKKEIEKKRTTSAEPIIYLCALVFIYLLVKAASDINHHYKSQAKGDKRLRRCSLQSYAQTHKQERRASKDPDPRPVTAISNRYVFLEQRSQSFDRSLKSRPDNISQGSLLTKSLRKNISVDETMIAQRFGTNPLNSTSMAGRPTHRDGINLSERKILTGSDSFNTDYDKSRRCSVPVSLGSQTPNTSRRTSMAWGSNAGVNTFETSENKRRVRMINRH